MGQLIGYWNFTTGTGTTVYDKSGYGTNGIMSSMDDTNWVQGVNLKDLCLWYKSGDVDRVDFGVSSPLNSIGNGSFTFCFWMKSFDLTPNNNGLMASKFVDANDLIMIQSNGTTNQLRTVIGKGGTVITTDYNAAPFDTKWHFIAMIVDRTLHTVTCYIDGKKDGVEGDLNTLPYNIANNGNVMLGATWSGGQPFEGYIDEFRIYLGTLTLNEIIFLYKNPNGQNKYDVTNGLIGLWPLDKGQELIAYDRSGNNNHGAIGGVAGYPVWVNGISGYALDFDGNNDNVNCGNSSPLNNLGSDDFSISFWLKSKDSIPISNSRTIGKYQNADNLIIIRPSGTSTHVQFLFRKSAIYTTSTFTNSIAFDAEWHHVVMVIDRSNDKVFCFVDSIRDLIEGNLSTLPSDGSNTGDFELAGSTTGGTYYEGILDEVRVYDRILSKGEINYLFYNPNGVKNILKNIDLEVGLMGLWHLDEGAGFGTFDNSKYTNNGAFQGGMGLTNWINGVSSFGLYFDGVNNRIYISNSFPLTTLGDSDFSISFWMKSKDNTPLNYGIMITKYLDSSNHITVNSNGTVNQLRFVLEKSGVAVATNFYAAPFDTNWHHIAIIVDRNLDIVYAYMDGIKDTIEGDLSTLADDCSNTAPLSFGATHDGSIPYEGSIDEIRIYNKALTRDEVLFLYNNPNGLNIIDDYLAENIMQLYIQSPTGEILGILSDQNTTGNILDAKVNVLKDGGVNTFSFRIAKTTDIPITLNSECYFYLNENLIFSGFIKEEPKSDQDAPIFIIEGEGFFKRLKRRIVNRSYTSKSLNFIICDILETYLPDGNKVGVSFNPYKINPPNISSITIEFKDKSLDNVLLRLLKICNHDYSNIKYRLYVDNYRDVVIESLSTSIIKTLFEGHNFQSPEVTIDNSKIINRVKAYRTVSGDPDTVQFVSTYNDTDSQGKYGIFSKKITFPDYIDSTTIGEIADYILSKLSDPQINIKLSNVFFEDIFIFGDYIISNKRELYWRIISDCDSFDGWDISNLLSTTASLSTDHILTGRQSIKIVTTSGSAGDYLEYELDDGIHLPQTIRLFIYCNEQTPQIKFTFYDNKGNQVFETKYLFSDQWMKYSKTMSQQTVVETLEVNLDVSTVEDMEVDIDPSTEEIFEVRRELAPSLLSIKKVRIEILSSTVTTFYIDRLDVYADIYSWHKVQLEELMYNLSSVNLYAEINFGTKQDNLINEIKDNMDENNLALQIMSKG